MLRVSPLTSASTLVVKTSSDNDVFRGFSCVVVVVGVGCGGSTEVGTGTGGGLGSMSVWGRYAEFVSASNNSFTNLAVSGDTK